MRIADLWFSALWVLLVPTCRSLALATAKINGNGLFGIPSGGSTSTKTRAQATGIESSASSAEMAPSSVSIVPAASSSSEVCLVSLIRLDSTIRN